MTAEILQFRLRYTISRSRDARSITSATILQFPQPKTMVSKIGIPILIWSWVWRPGMLFPTLELITL